MLSASYDCLHAGIRAPQRKAEADAGKHSPACTSLFAGDPDDLIADDAEAALRHERRQESDMLFSIGASPREQAIKRDQAR